MTAPFSPVGDSRTSARKRSLQYVRKAVMYLAMITLGGCPAICPVEPDIPLDQDFVVSMNPATAEVAQGTSAPITITVDRKGITGPIDFDVFSDLPAGVTLTLRPTTLPAGVSTAAATLTVAANASIRYLEGGFIATEDIVVRAKAGELVRYGKMKYKPVLSSTAGLTMNVQPSALTIAPGQYTEAYVKVLRQGGYTGPITIETYEVGGGATAADGITATIAAVQGVPDTYMLRVNASATAKSFPAPKEVGIIARGVGLANGVIAKVDVNVINPTFAPRTLREPRFRAGESDTVTVLLGRGTGFKDPITMSLVNPPAGVTGTFSPNIAIDDATVLTLNATAAVTPGRYSVQIRGVPVTGSGATPQTYTLNFDIDAPAPNAYFLLVPNLNVIRGNSTSSILNVTRNNAFVDPIIVNFSLANGAALPAGLSVSIDQNPITGNFTTIRASATTATPSGTYNFLAVGIAPRAKSDTAKFDVVVTAPLVPTAISIGKLLNGVPQALTSEAIAVSQLVALRAIVFDQNGQPMPTEGVNWTSSQPTTAKISANGDLVGLTTGTATITATSITTPAIKASIVVTVSPFTTPVTRMVLEPGNGEITAPASQQYSVSFYNSTGTRIDPEVGTTVSYASSNSAIASVNDTTGVVKGVSAGTVTIRATYSRNGVTIMTASAALLVYAPGTANHYGSATLSTNSNNTRTIRAGQSLLFQLYVYDVNNVQKPTGVTPAPVIKSSNTAVIISPSTITGGYFYTMTVPAGLAAGTTFTIRYDVMGAGGEIVMTVVP